MSKRHLSIVFLLLGLGLCLPRANAEPPPASSPLHPHLAPLRHLLGHWQSTLTLEGSHYRFELDAAPQSDGHVIVAQLRVAAGEKVISTSTEIFFWKPERKVIAAMSFNSQGRRFAGDLIPHGRAFTRKWTGIDENGRKIKGVNKLEMMDENTMRFQMVDIRIDGRKVPDQPVLTVRRVQKP